MEQSLLSTSNAIENKAATLSIKLPKLEIISFDGDIFTRKEFWDSFETVIHKNVHLSPVEKLNYLKTKLSGEAVKLIGGLTLSNENYDISIQLLKERYGSTQIVINAHYMSLLNLAPALFQTESLRNFMIKWNNI